MLTVLCMPSYLILTISYEVVIVPMFYTWVAVVSESFFTQGHIAREQWQYDLRKVYLISKIFLLYIKWNSNASIGYS